MFFHPPRKAKIKRGPCSYLHNFSLGTAMLRSSMPPSDQLHLAAMLGWEKAVAPVEFHVESCRSSTSRHLLK